MNSLVKFELGLVGAAAVMCGGADIGLNYIFSDMIHRDQESMNRCAPELGAVVMKNVEIPAACTDYKGVFDSHTTTVTIKHDGNVHDKSRTMYDLPARPDFIAEQQKEIQGSIRYRNAVIKYGMPGAAVIAVGASQLLYMRVRKFQNQSSAEQQVTETV